MTMFSGYDNSDAAAVSRQIVEKPHAYHSFRARMFYSRLTDAFGDVAKDPKERTLRFLEEAIELAQAAGLDREVVSAMADRVYAKEPGAVAEEIGQCLNTLEQVGIVFDVSPDASAEAQFRRFQSLPVDYWRERQEKKKALGLTADAPSRSTQQTAELSRKSE